MLCRQRQGSGSDRNEGLKSNGLAGLADCQPWPAGRLIRGALRMTLFNMVGAFLAALLAFSVVLYVTVVGGVLAYHKTLEALRHLRSKRARLAAGRQAD